jgi:phospholipid transport system substrate-binding protein
MEANQPAVRPLANRPATRRLAAFLLLVALPLMQGATAARAQEAPDVMVKRVAEDVLATIRSDPAIQAGNETRIREVLETKLLPNFDFLRMTSLAMGKNWRAATPEQQKRLADEFRGLLVRTYSGALNRYRNETIEYKPLRMNAGDTEVTVRTAVMRASAPPIQIDYGLVKAADTWKCSDVVIGGVSLVTNYRDEFNEQIKNGGVDGLIKTLADRNKGVAAK